MKALEPRKADDMDWTSKTGQIATETLQMEEIDWFLGIVKS